MLCGFDLLDSGGKNVRREPLLDRKHELRRIIGSGLPPIIYADRIEGLGVALFEKGCELDLEGIVAKYKHAPYDPGHNLVQDTQPQLFSNGRSRGTVRAGATSRTSSWVAYLHSGVAAAIAT